MGMWRRKESEKAATAACCISVTGNGRRIPKGYVPMVLIGDEGDSEEKVLVHVRILKEPCMEKWLEMAAQQFGYGQQGVLRIPCDTQRFKQTINTTCKANRQNIYQGVGIRCC